MPLRFVITGTGRCGTQFVSTVLSSLGVPTGHETVYTTDGPQEVPEGVVGDASWLAVPYLDGFDGKIIHLTRDPDQVKASLERIHFFDPIYQPQHQPYLSFLHRVYDGPIFDADLFVDTWTEDLDADLTIDIADLNSPEGWTPLWPVLGVPEPPAEILAEAIHRFRYVNIRGHIPLNDVTIGFVHDQNILIDFANFLYACGRRDLNVIGVQAGSRVASGRNTLVRRFLEETNHSWLFMIDTDHHVPLRSLELLFAVADPEERPLVGGITFRRTDQNTLEPTAYRFDLLSKTFKTATELPDNTLVPVDATGAACLLIHRSVLEAMGEKYPKPYTWFQDTQLGEHELGEDITFCFRVKHSGFPIFVHTGAEFPHIKLDGLTWRRWKQERALHNRYAALLSEQQTEESLLAHYDSVPTEYYSPLDKLSFSSIIRKAGVRGVEYPVLDLGCGDGRLISHLFFSGPELKYVGIDYSRARIEAAIDSLPQRGFKHPVRFENDGYLSGGLDRIEFAQTRIQDYTPGARQFPLIVMIEVLEHLEDPKAVIEQARSWLTEDGHIVATVPVDMPYHAHLHNFKHEHEVIELLAPEALSRMEGHWILRFDATPQPLQTDLQLVQDS